MIFEAVNLIQIYSKFAILSRNEHGAGVDGKINNEMSFGVVSKGLLLTHDSAEFSILIGTQNISSHIDLSFHYFV